MARAPAKLEGAEPAGAEPAGAEPWGFDLSTITVPVRIWQGELDRLVPWAHGQWLAEHIPGAVFRLAEGHGHFSLGAANRAEILNDLLGAARRR